MAELNNSGSLRAVIRYYKMNLNHLKLVFICEDCHRMDKNIVKCEKTFDKHTDIPFIDICDICGKVRTVHYCGKYSQYVQDNSVNHNN